MCSKRQRPNCCVLFGSTLVLAASAGVAFFGWWTLNSDAFSAASRLVWADTAGIVSLKLIAQGAFFAGASTGVLAIFGCMSALCRCRCCLCSFCLLAALLALGFIAASAGISAIMATAGPQLQRHSNEFCDSASHSALVKALQCRPHDQSRRLSAGQQRAANSTVGGAKSGPRSAQQSAKSNSSSDGRPAPKVAPAKSKVSQNNSVQSDSSVSLRGQSLSSQGRDQNQNQSRAATRVRPMANTRKGPTCGDSCGKWVDLLSRAGGCPTLNAFCQRRTYRALSLDSDCPPLGATKLSLRSDASYGPEACRAMCARRSDCNTAKVGDSGRCGLYRVPTVRDLQPMPWFPSPLGWAFWKTGKAVSPAVVLDIAVPSTSDLPTSSTVCYQQGVTLVMARFSQVCAIAVASSLVMGILLVMVSCCTCGHIYQLSSPRDARRGLCRMCCVIVCPCWAGDSAEEREGFLKLGDDFSGSGEEFGSDDERAALGGSFTHAYRPVE